MFLFFSHNIHLLISILIVTIVDFLLKCNFLFVFFFFVVCSFFPPHVKRKRKLEEMGHSYKQSLSVADFYMKLFTGKS